jgi:methylenetetrahydrofolate--tRNA-(uracil-5-)-methyltransferase
MAKGEPFSTPPRTTAIGALAYYVSHANPAHYEPSNITFGIMPPLDRAPKDKLKKKLAIADRALHDLEQWQRKLSPAEDLEDLEVNTSR